MRIGPHEIGAGHPVYVIAEIGVNHDGSVERALSLVDAAAEAGANAVKLQLFRADLLMGRAARLAQYQRTAGESDPAEMLRRLELSAKAMGPIVERAHKRGLQAIVTVFSTDLFEEARTLAWDAYKSASPDIIHRPLLLAMAATGKPMIVSTGAATIEEVKRAATWLADFRSQLALLQCVSSYPTSDEFAALGGIRAIAQATALPVGYSDHTPGADTGALAVAAGACILEKHLTYDRRATGPDHAASLDQAGFKEYVRFARRTSAMVGRHEKAVSAIEHDVRSVSRQSLTTSRALGRGHVLTDRDLTVKRPGTGIEPFRLEEIIGRRLARNVEADMPLTPGDLA